MTVVSKWIPSQHHSDRLSRSVDLIILHFTGGHGDESSLGKLFATQSRKAASHYGIGRTGTVAQYVSEERSAWHAGDGKYRGEKPNARSIGIELCNRGFAPSKYGRSRVDARHRNPRSTSTSWECYTTAQIVSLQYLLAEIANRRPGIVVCGHEDVTNHVTLGTDGAKLDPGPAFDWSWVKTAGLRRVMLDFATGEWVEP